MKLALVLIIAAIPVVPAGYQGPGWYQVGEEDAFKFIVSGPFATERDCLSSLRPAEAYAKFACVRFDKTPDCKQAWIESCPADDFDIPEDPPAQ
jgi:hypothetical protein